ncbi:MAG: YraN family protein [Sulfurimonas sp.]|uniref:YraN family protein n=1 Tax=Sulfurimonas sp. TaxID=2022749 RepID=UPI00260BE659|nr:YraN family protein [Sulfurimonas sp.]MDD2652917.1 YraN family protein [Sulfurimonas sp.]MDD3452363.1 YraN family protein [Sulfurimonas sp.]
MSRAKGDYAEERAYAYLLEKGFMVVERNFSSRFGEIDIIATKGGVLHFVEVKSALDYELAIQNITKSKLSKLIKTGDVYLKKNALHNTDYMHDAIIVTPLEIWHLENITI